MGVPPDSAEHLRRLDALRTLVSAARASASSPGNEVTVTVGPGQAVLDVVITSRGVRAGSHALGELIVAAARQAGAELSDNLAARAAELTPGQTSLDVVLGRALPPAPPLELQLAEIADAEEAVPPPPGFPAMDGIEAALAGLRTHAVEQHARYVVVRDAMTQLSVTGHTPDDTVRAAVATSGLISIEIEPIALRRTPEGISALVLAAIRDGAARLAQAMAALAQPAAGPIDIAAMVREHLPTEAWEGADDQSRR